MDLAVRFTSCQRCWKAASSTCARSSCAATRNVGEQVGQGDGCCKSRMGVQHSRHAAWAPTRAHLSTKAPAAREANASAHLEALGVVDPALVAQGLGDQLTQRRVAEGQPAARGDAVGLVLELLRENVVEGPKDVVLQDVCGMGEIATQRIRHGLGAGSLATPCNTRGQGQGRTLPACCKGDMRSLQVLTRVDLGHAVDALGGNDRQVCHAHLQVPGSTKEAKI